MQPSKPETVAADPSAIFMVLKKRIRTTEDGGPCRFCRKVTDPPHDHTTCPLRPCYLCKNLGHHQPDCPHRLRPGAQERALKELMAARSRLSQPFHFVHAAQLGQVVLTDLHVPSPQVQAKIVANAQGAHAGARRVTTLDFRPGTPCQHVLSGDKRGTVAIWDLGCERADGKYPGGRNNVAGGCTIEPLIRYPSVHRCNVNAVRFIGTDTLVSSSADGCVNLTHMDVSGRPLNVDVLLNLNPNGWTNARDWTTAHGLACARDILPSSDGDPGHGLSGTSTPVYAGDSRGSLYALDTRCALSQQLSLKAHKAKIQHLDIHPLRQELMCSSSLDKTIRLWDTRMLQSPEKAALCTYTDEFSIASACFSPRSGSKLLVTTLQNKLLLFKDLHAFGSGVAPEPDLSIVHSHRFNRYLSVFQSVWDPKDFREDLFLCGRFLGEAYNVPDELDPVMLHPIDLFSASSGTLIASLADTLVRTVCPLNRFHPTEDLIVSGSSQHLYLWGCSKSAVDETGPSLSKAAENDEEECRAPRKKPRGSRRDTLNSSIVLRKGR